MTSTTVARINGTALHAASETLLAAELRQRTCTELLRQEAQRVGLLDAADAPASGGSVSEAACAAIEALIDREVRVPAPTEEACRRYFAAQARSFASGERLHVRHVLFAVTAGTDVGALRKRAEATLVEVRTSATLPEVARTLSNCPSGASGGDLGWITRAECAPEFAKQLFEHAGVGVLPRLVQSRHGFHVVEIVARDPGIVPAFEAVQEAVSRALERQGFVTALQQYLRVLAGAAAIEGVDLDGADTPLVQ